MYFMLDGDGEIVGAGLAKTYGRGVNALDRASNEPDAERFHDLRKRVKYSWYHTQLITPTAPVLLDALADRWHDLSDALGDAHDLAVLGEQLLDEPEAFGGEASVHATIELFGDVRRTLEARSITLGRRLYAETPRQIVRRLGTYWSVWRELGPQLAVGEIDDIFKADKRFNGYTVRELIAFAGQAGIVGRFSMRRAALVSALTAAGVRPR